MYVRRLRLKNIRCFEEFELPFEPTGGSALLIGDNNAGKSTVLRSLAMGLCDQSSASALFRELPGEFVRRGSARKASTLSKSEPLLLSRIDPHAFRDFANES